MASKYWIKLYHEMLHDPKMGRLPDRLYRRCIELFLMAGEENDEGHLPATEDIAWVLRTNASELLSEMRALAAVGILTEQDGHWTVTNFATRQGPASDAERMVRMRERNRQQQYRGDDVVTERNKDGYEKLVDTDTDTDTDTDVEEIGAGAPPAEPPAPKLKSSRKRASAADPRTQHAAIQACKHVRGRYPNKDVYDVVIGALGDNPDVDKLRGCYEEWRVRGYNPDNMGWAVDWYVNGIAKPNSRASPTARKQVDIAKRQDMIRRFAQGGDPSG